MLSFRDLLTLTNSSSSREVTIDFSSISVDRYAELKTALLHYTTSKIVRLQFNVNLGMKHAQTERCLPADLEGSIARQHPDFTREVAALVSRILSRAKKLRHFTLKSIPFTFCDIDVICQGIQVGTSIRSLSFIHIPLEDDGFVRLSGALQKPMITSVTCRGCCLTDSVSRSLRSLLRFHSELHKQTEALAKKERRSKNASVTLSSLDLRENMFTKRLIGAVSDLVQRSTVHEVDLRDNTGIAEGARASGKFVLGETPERLSGSATSAQKLRRENEVLGARIERIIGEKNVAALNDTTFVMGRRAPELADQILLLDRLCLRLDRANRKRRSKGC